MYLKSLKLVGFKSFADRTRLELRPGVTVIVGPNGSGKSNIVDAVAWVMGTQSPKSLRTSKMDDVIFAGTATRPGLARAEVTLVLDNASGAVALDLPEVSITRRLYRDGSSDYEINGVPCRLLDIQELLSDSGVGRHQHVIIGQGQIDGILSATSDDHRAVIEEAAGILKHRVRKDKAIRRLERTDADVLRLRDLLGEMARQMRPLKRQAAAAARYDGIAAEVKALRLFTAGEELRAIATRRAALTSEEQDLRTRVAEGIAEGSDLGAMLTILRRDAGDVGEALDRDTEAAARIETTLERLRRIAQVAHERHRAGVARLEGADERRRDLESEASQLEADLEEARTREDSQRRAVEAAERRFRALEDEERSLADQEGMSIEGAIAVVRGDLRSIDAADERDGRESTALARRLGALAGQVAEERAEAVRITAEIRDIDGLVMEAQGRYTEAERARTREQEAWERRDSAHADARVGLAAARARLEAMQQAATGMADAEARSMAEGAAGAKGALAVLLDAPDDLTAAVDAALGSWADAIAFGSGGELDDAVAALKGAGRGGVPMVTPASPVTDGARLGEAARATGLDRLVDRLGSSADRALAEILLGDVVVAEGWRAGRHFAVDHPTARVVTPEGDLITASGVRVAHPDGATPAMVEAAQVAVERAETDLARASSLLTQARRGFEDCRQTERDALETLEALEAQLAGATEALARIERAIVSATQEIGRLEERRAGIVESAASREAQRCILTERLMALEGEEAERQRAWDDLVRRRQEVAAAREDARANWQDASAAHRATVERVAMLTDRSRAVAAALRNEIDHPIDPGRLDRLAAIETAARQALDALREHIEQLRERQADLRSRAGQTGRRLGEVQARHDEVSGWVSEAKERLSALAVEATELRMRGEAVAEAVRRDADASEEEAMVASRPECETDDLAGLLASREAELRRMGPVNPLAAAEYAELVERHDFLTGQLDDLEASRDELRKVIRALDDEIQQQFMGAFQEIADAYQRHFGVLFPGGRGRLRLSDPDAPLTAGVEIEAQPLGKKVSKMTLLSGGERSLAALAFLFAVFEARPSPFYVLDEVEAALDDANLHRFLRLLDSFRASAQLLIVTHQQQTMETGDVLYGVTMEPGGSSKVVAKAMHPVEPAMADAERLIEL